MLGGSQSPSNYDIITVGKVIKMNNNNKLMLSFIVSIASVVVLFDIACWNQFTILKSDPMYPFFYGLSSVLIAPPLIHFYLLIKRMSGAHESD